jgi:hypothetical protein
MIIICEHCKSEIANCPSCNLPELNKNVTFNVVLLFAFLIASLVSFYRWHSALDSYERAQKLRRAYIKEKLQNTPSLPFTK